jgi:TonB family protein
MRHWLILFIALPIIWLPAMADDAAASPEQLRFEAAKRARTRSATINYLRLARSRVERSWQPTEVKVLSITKVKIALNSNGKVTSSHVLAPSKSSSYDKSLTSFLETLTLDQLPSGLSTIDLYLTFMADPTMSMVEFAQLPEADNYYRDLVGAPMAPIGMPQFGSSAALRTHFSRSGVSGTNGITISVGAPNAPATLTPQSRDLAPYVTDVERRIKRAWFPPKGNESKRVVLQFKIHTDGALSNLRVDHSSGLAIADQAALKAIENGAPFRPLPANAPESINLQMKFGYDASGGDVHGAAF